MRKPSVIYKLFQIPTSTCCFSSAPSSNQLQYSYPLLPNQVPAQAVVLLCFTAPFAVILPFYLAGRISRVVAHHGLLQAFAAVVITGLITNLIKLNVGCCGCDSEWHRGRWWTRLYSYNRPLS